MTITVDHPAFRAALADLARATERLDRSRTRAGAEVRGLLDGGWVGPAADAFAAGWAEWSDGAAAVSAGLAALRDLLDAVHRDLVAADAASQAALDRMAAGVAAACGALR
ncbi:WXG100 family type VII secretion target [Nocardioides sp. KIGAM211]|uniref:WXG100 family type VII secretion target n=1 Tax=Nocardioides luti TaxID=2761101 RepID=A0A7X0RF53_9ACTN|nr:WXG100 family type VII secretion target [Nocardioides luti]MBB6627141.1 WXG100 family type VII secretion target [Nocardioides luti]